MRLSQKLRDKCYWKPHDPLRDTDMVTITTVRIGGYPLERQLADDAENDMPSIIDGEVELAEGAKLSDCVIMKGAKVKLGLNVRMVACTVGPGVEVVLGDDTVASYCRFGEYPTYNDATTRVVIGSRC